MLTITIISTQTTTSAIVVVLRRLLGEGDLPLHSQLTSTMAYLVYLLCVVWICMNLCDKHPIRPTAPSVSTDTRNTRIHTNHKAHK